MIVGGAEDRGDAAVVVENVLEIGEAVILLGPVVNRIGAAVRRFDAEAVGPADSRPRRNN
jgi:hypothetical protein